MMEIIKTGMVYRSAQIRGVEDRTIDLAFSSEEPVERSFGTEILDHDDGSVDMEFMNTMVKTRKCTIAHWVITMVHSGLYPGYYPWLIQGIVRSNRFLPCVIAWFQHWLASMAYMTCQGSTQGATQGATLAKGSGS